MKLFLGLLATVGLLAQAQITSTTPSVSVRSGTIAITNAVTIGNFPSPLPVTLSTPVPVTVGGTVAVTGSVGLTTTSIAVNNFPAVQAVTLTGQPVSVTGSNVGVTNQPTVLQGSPPWSVTLASPGNSVFVGGGSITLSGGSTSVTNAISLSGKTSVTLLRRDYSTSSVTTSAYSTLIASLPDSVTAIDVFDSSGQTLVLASGGDKIYIYPGGNSYIPLILSSGASVSIKAISSTTTGGELDINFLK